MSICKVMIMEEIMKVDLTLYLISDSTGLTEDEFLRRLEQALQGGVDVYKRQRICCSSAL